jgi:membrane protease YdiL (CAAX protease family)
VVPLGAGGSAGGVAGDLVMSIGAGLYEELVFRLLAVSGAYALLHRFFRMTPVGAAVLAILMASLLFSAYHHVGAGGEPWDAGIFAFRFLAGVILSWLFLLRGFAVVCWTHALYDVLCVLL